MAKQKQSSSGQASKKPTPNEIELKRQKLKEKLRSDAMKKSGITNVVDGVEKRKKENQVVEKTIPKKEAIKNHAKDLPRLKKENYDSALEITNRNHTYRIKRMAKVFGQERVDALQNECKTPDEFKWELYQAEVRQEITIKEMQKKDPDFHLYKPNAPGSAPVEFEWRGENYQIDAQTDFDPALLEKLVRHLAGNGSVYSFCARNNIPTRKFKRWTKYQCVRDAIDYGIGMTLDTYERVSHALACGIDTTKMNEQFVKAPQRNILQNLLKHRHKSQYFEKEIDNDDDKKDVAMLEGEALKKKVAELKERRARMDAPNPFAEMKPYKSEK